MTTSHVSGRPRPPLAPGLPPAAGHTHTHLCTSRGLVSSAPGGCPGERAEEGVSSEHIAPLARVGNSSDARGARGAPDCAAQPRAARPAPPAHGALPAAYQRSPCGTGRWSPWPESKEGMGAGQGAKTRRRVRRDAGAWTGESSSPSPLSAMGSSSVWRLALLALAAALALGAFDSISSDASGVRRLGLHQVRPARSRSPAPHWLREAPCAAACRCCH